MRSQFFTDLGLKMPSLTGVPLNRNLIFTICLFITVFVSTGTFLYAYLLKSVVTESCTKFYFPNPVGFSGAVVWTISTVVMHSIAVIAAYVVQNSLLTYNDSYKHYRAVSLINLDFMLAFFFGFSLNIFFLALMLSNGAFSHLTIQWKWAMVPGVSAYFVGFYIAKSKKDKDLKWKFVFLQGIFTMLVALVVLFWNWNIVPADVVTIFTCENARIYLLYCLFSTFVIGAFLGYISQKLIRSSMEQS
jgi:hypothetical protein